MKKFTIYILTVFFIFNFAHSEIIKKIVINGNKRVSEETIKIYGEIEINKDYKEDVQQLQYDSKWSLDQVLNLKELWSQLNDENKEIIWTYFSVLIKLVELEYNA